MKKILVLVVLFALFAGVVPARVEAKLLPKRTPFGGTLPDFIWASQDVEVGSINDLDAETGRVSIWPYNGGPTDFYITENTTIRFDYSRGEGSFDDLYTADKLIINYYFRQDVAYARYILILEQANWFFGYIRDVDLDNRTIIVREPDCCFDCDPDEYIIYIPEIALIMSDWDEDLHEFNELDEMKSYWVEGYYYDIDNIPYLITPFIFIYGELSIC